MSKVRPEIEQRINEKYNKFREQYDEISNKYQKDIDLINKDMLNKINNKKNELLGEINNNSNNISNNLITKRLSQYKIIREINEKIENEYEKKINDRKKEYNRDIATIFNKFENIKKELERNEKRVSRQNNNLPVHTPKKMRTKEGGKKKTKRKSTAKKSPNKSKSKK